MKQMLQQHLVAEGHTVEDLGPTDTQSVDYPDYAHSVAAALKNQPNAKGILICGSGIGMDITANKHKHVRAALVHNAKLAGLSRQHNDANILCLGARFIDDETARACADKFLTTEFEGGRHANRVNKINQVFQEA